MQKVIISGGGLAGFFTAAACCRRGMSVVHFVPASPSPASLVAGGLFNVITGKQMSLTWKAHELMKSLHGFFDHHPFSSLRKHLNHIPLYRPFADIREANEVLAKLDRPEYREFVELVPKSLLPDQVLNPEGGIMVPKSGYLMIQDFLTELPQLLKEQFSYQHFSAALHPHEINEQSKVVKKEHQSFEFDAIVFCEGVSNSENPFFNWIDIRPLKGQLALVEVPGFDPGFILNKKAYLVPKGNYLFGSGSTYEKDFTDAEPDERGRQEISEKIAAHLKVPFSIKAMRAGIRPTTPNRRPVAGGHPDLPGFYILNGLGTKGVLQAPFMAEMLADIISDERGEPEREISVHRFKR